MYKKLSALLLGAVLLSSCGNNPYVRAATGGALGAGVAFAVDGNPLIGAVAGAGIGYLTNRDYVDIGDAPLGY